MRLPALRPYTRHSDSATHNDATAAHTAPEADLLRAVRLPALKRLGGHHLCHGQVAQRGLQALPQRDNPPTQAPASIATMALRTREL
jgi:hypothetical protein